MTSVSEPESGIISELSKDTFNKSLVNNPGVFIIKFGAEWCGPCKVIEQQVKYLMGQMPADKTINAIIDVDESIEVYMFLKTKKMVSGIPAILCYKKGNHTFIPDDSVVGGDPNGVNDFFKRCTSYIT